MAMTTQQLLAAAETFIDIGTDRASLRTDCDRIVYMLKNCTITVPAENRFFVAVNAGEDYWYVNRVRVVRAVTGAVDPVLLAGEQTMAYTGSYDFGHTSACWEDVLRLGIFGLRQRVADYAAQSPEEKKHFYTQLLRVWDGVLEFMLRAADAAEKAGKPEMAAGLRNLTEAAPGTFYEAMQTILVYYNLQQHFDGTVLRTLGRLDGLLYPWFRQTPEQDIQALIADFLAEVDRREVDANVPFALGGADAQGNCLVNELSYLLLQGYQAGSTAYIKLHLLCTWDMPEDFLELALDTVRSGKNSIVFLSDARVAEGLEKLGASHEDAARYHVVGCYECGADQELTCSCNARVNLVKALELTLNRGVDMCTGTLVGLENDGEFPDFDTLFREFQRQTAHLSRCAMALTDQYEVLYPRLHSAPILSATYISALEKGVDIYSGGARYCNSSVNAVGLATACDALAAIRKLVYTDSVMPLEQLVEILKNNWDGQELLRRKIQNKFPKFGTADPETDALAQQTVLTLAEAISGRPNAKGGVYRLGLFSINWRWALGEKTAASADGRFAGEPMSQNTGASFGADREGMTAHLLSVAGLDTSHTPNGAIVDIDLHASAVRGGSGLKAMLAALQTYIRQGGFGVQFNVLDAQVLRKAKADPQAYPNLQVRLCGWNALFSSLSEKEKDEFIRRWEGQG